MAESEFLIAEYTSLREEIKWIIAQAETLENFALITSGALWGWLIAQPWRPEFLGGVWLPFLITSLFYVKRKALSASLREIADYVMKLESHFSLSEGLGWQHHLTAKSVAHFKSWRRHFWAALIGVNILFAIILSIRNA